MLWPESPARGMQENRRRLLVALGVALTGGFWGNVERPGEPVVEYDALHPVFDWKYPLDGLLRFFVREGVFSERQLHDGLLHFEQPHGHLTSEGAQLAYVVVNLKRAAAN